MAVPPPGPASRLSVQTRLGSKDVQRFCRDGFCVIAPCLAPDVLAAFQAECHALSCGVDLDETDCVVDLWAESPVDDNHQARSDLVAYRRERSAMVAAAFASAQASDLGHVRRSARDVVLDAIVGPLAEIAAQAFSAMLSPRQSRSESTSRDGDSLEECRAAIRLFNEHYVVKPGSTGVEFGWHTDQNEQLSMCMKRPDLPYLSLWIPLCDTTEANGTLELLPRGQPQPPVGADKLHPFFTKLATEVEDPPGESRECTKEDGEGGESSAADVDAPICRKVRVCAGGAVLFSSDVWHRSGPNRSASPRPVFYAQYTCGVLRSDGSLGARHDLHEGKDAGAQKSRRLAGPLAFAVPCRVGLSAGGEQRVEIDQEQMCML